VFGTAKFYSDHAAANRDTQSIVQISRSNIYRFGDPNFAAPVFRDVHWTVGEGENWAVIGTGSKQKTALLQVRHDVILKCLYRQILTEL
jgi:ABC-type molybdenum transport system ATPase subunit/photorepair protein PhrA